MKASRLTTTSTVNFRGEKREGGREREREGERTRKAEEHFVSLTNTCDVYYADDWGLAVSSVWANLKACRPSLH